MAEQSVIDDSLEHHIRVVLYEIGRSGRMNRTLEPTERADVAVAQLVYSLLAARVGCVEPSSGRAGQSFVEDEGVTAHVDLDVRRDPARDAQRHERRHRRPVNLQSHWD